MTTNFYRGFHFASAPSCRSASLQEAPLVIRFLYLALVTANKVWQSLIVEIASLCSLRLILICTALIPLGFSFGDMSVLLEEYSLSEGTQLVAKTINKPPYTLNFSFLMLLPVNKFNLIL